MALSCRHLLRCPLNQSRILEFALMGRAFHGSGAGSESPRNILTLTSWRSLFCSVSTNSSRPFQSSIPTRRSQLLLLPLGGAKPRTFSAARIRQPKFVIVALFDDHALQLPLSAFLSYTFRRVSLRC